MATCGYCAREFVDDYACGRHADVMECVHNLRHEVATQQQAIKLLVDTLERHTREWNEIVVEASRLLMRPDAV